MTRTKKPVRFTGQHFTIDRDLILKAIKYADIQPQDTVLDIGAGKGFLTVHLIHHAREIIAIEKDKELVRLLKNRFSNDPNVIVSDSDFLKTNLPKRPFKVVSNIPFGITAGILRKLLFENQSYFLGGTLILSGEVARKLTSPHILNPQLCFYRSFYTIRQIETISPESFLPPPTISAALVSFHRHEALSDEFDRDGYLRFLCLVGEAPSITLRQALKKVFRKSQVRMIAYRFNLNIENTVKNVHPIIWKSIYNEMTKLVPRRYWP